MGRGEGMQFKAVSLREMLSAAVLLAGVVGAFSSLQVQLQNNTARIAVLEQSYVPRSEHAAREAEHEKREQEWSARLDRIEGKLDAALEKRSN